MTWKLFKTGWLLCRSGTRRERSLLFASLEVFKVPRHMSFFFFFSLKMLALFLKIFLMTFRAGTNDRVGQVRVAICFSIHLFFVFLKLLSDSESLCFVCISSDACTHIYIYMVKLLVLASSFFSQKLCKIFEFTSFKLHGDRAWQNHHLKKKKFNIGRLKIH